MSMFGTFTASLNSWLRDGQPRLRDIEHNSLFTPITSILPTVRRRYYDAVAGEMLLQQIRRYLLDYCADAGDGMFITSSRYEQMSIVTLLPRYIVYRELTVRRH